MFYNQFQELSLSALGLGAMRLPTVNGKIDEEKTAEMVDFAIASGLNYFDTAYAYHNGESELVMGRVLGRHKREDYYLASKYPGHQHMETYYPADIFEEQLKKCGVDYFDFYLLHNVAESSIEVYRDEKWGILPYFLEQKRLGRIKHLGFSTHAELPTLKEFLRDYGQHMEFCQIQLNYLDWTLQSAGEKYRLLTELNIPIWVMEPVRGGRLANLEPEVLAPLAALRPDLTPAAWAFRFLQGLPNVTMVLSGMSNMTQLKENLATFEERLPLTERETRSLFEAADRMQNSLPCTGCRYCVKECPMALDIPTLLSLYNNARISPAVTISMHTESLAADQLPSACLACGACSRACPQKIDIPAAMKDFDRLLKTEIPSWRKLCLEREEAAARLRAKK